MPEPTELQRPTLVPPPGAYRSCAVTAAAAATLAVLLALLVGPAPLPWSLPLLFVVVPAAQLALTPIWRRSGVYVYYSPMLFGVRRGSDEIELHGGTAYDYLTRMRWRQRGRPARRLLTRQFLAGLLALIDEIEAGRIAADTRVTATSYVFSERSARRLGFELRRAPASVRLHLLLDGLSLLAMYCYAQGRPSLPRLWRVSRAVSSAAELARHRRQLLTRLARLASADRPPAGTGLLSPPAPAERAGRR